MPVATIIGDPSNGNSPNTTSDTGMIAVRLHDIHMMVSLREKEAGRSTPPRYGDATRRFGP
jgi:hypothetical protein